MAAEELVLPDVLVVKLVVLEEYAKFVLLLVLENNVEVMAAEELVLLDAVLGITVVVKYAYLALV
jgi:hypothetical protein